MTVNITKLDNGLTVLTQAMPHLETVALGIWVKAGARDELPHENGIAHFLEHMAFKGTKRRSAQAIVEEIEGAGGEINASTGMETTTYYAKVLKQDWPLALDILADIFSHSTLDEVELERERDVILQEISAAHDQPDDLVFDLAQSACYGEHPLGRSILGTMELIEPMTRDQMLAWRQRNYLASRIVVCAAGNIEHEKFAAEAARLFSDLPGGEAPARATPTFHPGLLTAAKPLDQTHIVLTFPAPGYMAPEIYQLQILSNLLGGGMSSRLFQEVREKRGLCYNVFAFGSSYEDVGQIGLYAAATPDHTAELLSVSSDVMMSATRAIAPVEVARAKAQLKAALVMNLESASSRADQIARQYLAFGMVPRVSTLMEKIEAVSVDQVMALARQLFAQRMPALSAVGQLSRLSSHSDVAAHFARS